MAIDLTGVHVIDSAGINALLTGRRTAEKHGRTFVVTSAGGPERRLPDLTGVRSLLPGRA